MATDVQLRYVKFTADAELEELLAGRLQKLRQQLPSVTGTITCERRWVGYNAVAELRAEGFKLRAEAARGTARETMLDVFTDLTRLARQVRWERDGVRARCPWCEGGRFVHVRQTRDKTDSSGGSPQELLYSHGTNSWHGNLEALVCRTCGRIEWFVGDPDDLPVGEEHGTTEIRAADRPPYR